jgi:hypothetical protein
MLVIVSSVLPGYPKCGGKVGFLDSPGSTSALANVVLDGHPTPALFWERLRGPGVDGGFRMGQMAGNDPSGSYSSWLRAGGAMVGGGEDGAFKAILGIWTCLTPRDGRRSWRTLYHRGPGMSLQRL